MILEAGQVCPYKDKCPHSHGTFGACYGTRSDRTNKFECDFINNKIIINDSSFRNPLDKTGKMKVIME